MDNTINTNTNNTSNTFKEENIMYEWKVENMELMNNNHQVAERNRYGRMDYRFVYDLEDKLSHEEKIAFLNQHTNNLFTYISDIYDKYQAEKDSLKHDKDGSVNTNSFKAWIKKNDPKKKFDTKYSYGKAYFYSCDISLKWEQLSPNNAVDQAFHNLCRDLEKEEMKYFKAHDPYFIAVKEWRELGRHSFGNEISVSSDDTVGICCDEHHDERRLLTVEELQMLIDKSKLLNKYIEELSQDAHIEF